MKNPGTIILSRTDKIGDVVLTLPMAGALKQKFPECRLIFLGRNYTRDIVGLSQHVDDFISWDDARDLSEDEKTAFLKEAGADVIVHVFPDREIAMHAKKADIPKRIGTTGRLYHFRYCNTLVKFSRKRSNLHEAQLNFKLLKPLIGDVLPDFQQLTNYYGFEVKGTLDKPYLSMLDRDKFNLILHPKSKGSAREWPLENYGRLIKILPEEEYKIFISGTKEESGLMTDFLKEYHNRVHDLTGLFSLKEYILFINEADGLIAASTGPLHIAASLGKVAMGIYPPIKPMDPARWAPIGRNAHFLVADKNCSDCRASGDCRCMAEIEPGQVKEKIDSYAKRG